METERGVLLGAEQSSVSIVGQFALSQHLVIGAAAPVLFSNIIFFQ